MTTPRLVQPPPSASGPPAWLKVVGWAVAVATLAGVFLLYTRADLVVDLANQLWTCF